MKRTIRGLIDAQGADFYVGTVISGQKVTAINGTSKVIEWDGEKNPTKMILAYHVMAGDNRLVEINDGPSVQVFYAKTED